MKTKLNMALTVIIPGIGTALIFVLAWAFLSADQFKYYFIPLLAVYVVIVSFILDRFKKR